MPQTRCFGPIVEAIASNSEDGVILIDENGEVSYANAAAANQLGVANSRLLTTAGQLGPLNLPREIMRARIESGNPDAAGEICKKFIEFHKEIGSESKQKQLLIRTGVVELPGQEREVRVVLLREYQQAPTTFNEKVSNVPDKWISISHALTEILDHARQIAASSANVLIQGEVGTGKAKLSHRIHRLSERKNRPLVSIDCASTDPSTIAEQLFGTPANVTSAEPCHGILMRANHGTLLLRNIDCMPVKTQADLARALHSRDLHVIDSGQHHILDIRIIASTTRALMEEMCNGRFNQELYYAISVVPFTLPPLRERPEDIPLLVEYFRTREIPERLLRDIRFDNEVIEHLCSYHWPGNIPELMNAVRHCLICATGNRVTVHGLPRNILGHADSPFQTSLKQIEAENATRMKRSIKDALKRAKGKKSEAAKILDIDRTTLWRRMKRLDIHPH